MPITTETDNKYVDTLVAPSSTPLRAPVSNNDVPTQGTQRLTASTEQTFKQNEEAVSGIDNAFSGFGISMVITVFGLYMIPAMIAYGRKVGQRRFILMLNALIAWTIIGWVVLLVWAVVGRKQLKVKQTATPDFTTNFND